MDSMDRSMIDPLDSGVHKVQNEHVRADSFRGSSSACSSCDAANSILCLYQLRGYRKNDEEPSNE